MHRLKIDWRVAVGIGISVAALAALLTRVDLSRALDAVLASDAAWIGLGLLLINVNLLLRAWRWSILLQPVGRFPAIRECFPFYMIGYMANLLVPFRAGDLARAYLFGRAHRTSKTAVLATILLEHLFDALSVLLIAVVVTLAADVASQFKGTALALEGAGIGVIAAAWLLSRDRRWETRVIAWARRVPSKVGARMAGWLRNAVDALTILQDTRALLAIIAGCVSVWGVSYLAISAFLLASHIELPWYGPLLVIIAANLGMVVPAAPGNFGVAHLLYVSTLAWLGVSVERAFAFAILLHGIPFLWGVSVGLVAMWLKGLSFERVAEERRGPGTT